MEILNLFTDEEIAYEEIAFEDDVKCGIWNVPYSFLNRSYNSVTHYHATLWWQVINQYDKKDVQTSCCSIQ